MKRLLSLSLLLSAALWCASCGSDPEPLPAAGTLTVDPLSLDFAAEGGTQKVTLRTDAGSWSLRVADGGQWCVPDRSSGATGGSSFFVTASRNEGAKRETTLTFSAPGCADVEVAVSQAADRSARPGILTPEPQEWDGVKRGDLSYQVLVYGYADSDGDRIGDLNGLTAKLDYLDQMGVGAVWLSPIHPAKSYHGYDVLDYEKLNEDYGTMADFTNFIDKAHEHGIKVYLDYVINHTGKDHWWFTEACKSERNDYRDYFIFSKDPAADIAAGKIPMIASEGASGYDSGQWYTAPTGMERSVKYKFVLDWSDASAPTVTVTAAESVDPDNTDTSAGGRYLYFGDGLCKRFYDKGDGRYELSVDFLSSWGFLIRTSKTTWAAGEKWGAQPSNTVVTLGTPFRIYANSSSFDPANIELTKSYKYHSHFWTEWFVDLNYGPVERAEQSPAFAAITDAAKKWIDLGVDGFRLDAVKHIYHNAYSDENPRFLKKFYDELNRYYQRNHTGEFYMVGEMLDSFDRVAPYYQGLPALFEFSFWYKLKWALQNDTGCYFLKDILEFQPAYAGYRADYIEATKLSNHDEDRTGSDLGQYLPKLKLAGAVLLTAQGQPYIYMGEELGYWGVKANGDEYVRAPIVWDRAKQDMYAAYTTKLDDAMLTGERSVEAQAEDEQSILNVYRAFGRLRNIYPAMGKGAMKRHPVYNETATETKQIAAWYREWEGQKMLVVHNFGSKDTELSLTDDLKAAAAVLGDVSLVKENGLNKVTMGPYSSVVFEL